MVQIRFFQYRQAYRIKRSKETKENSGPEHLYVCKTLALLLPQLMLEIPNLKIHDMCCIIYIFGKSNAFGKQLNEVELCSVLTSHRLRESIKKT